MKIVVLVKEVPDTWGERRLDLETGIAERSQGSTVLDEISERALEVALAHQDRSADCEVIVVSMGATGVTESLRRGLAMGATRAVHITDPELQGADIGVTAGALAAAVTRVGFDLVIAGNASTDGSGGVIPSMIAELLGVPSLPNLGTVTIDGEGVEGIQIGEHGTISLRSSLPAVISITEALPDARLASFRGIMGAKKKELLTWTAAEIGAHEFWARRSRSIMTAVAEKPARESGAKFIDDGDAAEKLADFLVAQRLV